jgi:hypothetical protein
MRSGLALLFVSSVAFADSAPDQSNIIGGTTTTVGQYPTVVALTVGGGICTGTLIDKEWVLTAAHCIHPQVVGASSQAQVTANTRVHFDTVNVFQNAGTIIRAAETIPKPNFSLQGLGANDIGLIKLAQPVIDITPTPVNFNVADAPVGVTVTMVGFGATQRGGGGSVGQQFQLLDRSSTSCSSFGVSNTNLLCFSQTDNKGKCQGDSGGPSFATINGRQVVVGVTSFGDQNCAAFGADTRTDVEKAFLLQHVPQLEGCTTDDECGGGICFQKRCIAQPFTDGGIGSECVAGTECDSGFCAAGPDGMRCIEACIVGGEDACPDGFDCLGATGGGGACWPRGSDDSGCCDTSGRGGPTAMFAIGLVALLWRRRA